MSKYARLDAFSRGQIVAYDDAGWSVKQITLRVRKPSGRRAIVRGVRATIAKAAAEPDWRGARVGGSGGRPRDMTAVEEKEIAKLVRKHRGSAKVTISFCKKKQKSLRRYSRHVLSRSLHRAGLAWLRRRRKSWVPNPDRVSRRRYARWLLRQRRTLFKRFCYIDGSSFYLARTYDELGDKQRKSLGTHVWRMSTHKDGLFSDNVGPSLYASAQGKPVKIWGLLANGVLSYQVLPADGERTTHMNGGRFRDMLRTKTREWLHQSYGRRRPGLLYLIHDHERCL